MIGMEALKAKIEEGVRKMPSDKRLLLTKEQLQTLERIFLEALFSRTLNLTNVLNQINQLNEKKDFLNQVPYAVLDIIKPYFCNELNNMLPLFFEPEEEQEVVTEQDLKELFYRLLMTQLNTLFTQQKFVNESILLTYAEVKKNSIKSVQFLSKDQKTSEEYAAKSTLIQIK